MTKSKVGAEPKKERVRHAITKSEGIHEGIHRDEYGYYDSSYHCYCFAYGYFFIQLVFMKEWLIKFLMNY